MKLKNNVLALLMSTAAVFAVSSPVWAACSNPTGNEGDMIYNTTHDVMQFCNGSDQWISMSGAASGGGGSGVWSDDGPGGPAEIYYSGGNIGIGTNDPAYKLHVVETGSSDQKILTVRNDVDTAELFIGTDNATGAAAYIAAGSGDDLVLYSNDKAGTPNIFIDSSAGNVGINGVTTPRAALDVGGTIYSRREDATNEGGEIRLDYPENDGSTDEESSWTIDVYANGTDATASDPDLRFYRMDSGGSAVNPMVLTHEGNVGMGTYSPVGKLDVVGTTAVTAGNFEYWFDNTNDSSVSGRDSAWRLIANDGTGNVHTYINSEGGLSPTFETNGYVYHERYDPGGGDYIVSNSSTSGTAGGAITWQDNLWVVDGPTGYIGIGTNAPGTKLTVSGAVTATAYYHSSDIRLKKDVVPSGGLDVLEAIHGVTYRWKDNDKQASGIVAQDVEKVMPYAVSTNADGMKAVEYDQLIAPMIEAIKTLAEENKELKARIEALETRQDREL